MFLKVMLVMTALRPLSFIISRTYLSISRSLTSWRMSLIQTIPPGTKTLYISSNAAKGSLKFLKAEVQMIWVNAEAGKGKADALP